MLWIIFILSLPLLVWVWLGIAFTILIYVSEKTKEAAMPKIIETTPELARLIRYTELAEPSMPGLLSFFEEGKNILHIDREQAERLPITLRNRLEMTTETFTMVARHGTTFSKYNLNEHTLE